ncbi:hypothetical protein [Maledivibacter halophilus]|uniref:Uncharacterized protein n=1 Tax=Maledivibacter halophilus TaxID=36842 RepID=A0A1T5M8N4_9FIRM|nr:hypothetical protein [Maledivibacter halophilus]SKC84606.1 hypothetical protein SAMN02194393_04184 [Maledivibacter halophilus]
MWSTYIAEEPEWYGDSFSVQKILIWAQNNSFDMIEIERLELLATLMIWFTSTSNRYVRDTATKIL